MLPDYQRRAPQSIIMTPWKLSTYEGTCAVCLRGGLPTVPPPTGGFRKLRRHGDQSRSHYTHRWVIIFESVHLHRH